MRQAAAHTTTRLGHTSTLVKGHHKQGSSGTKRSPNPRQDFMVAALNMSWQLAIVVLVPILIGVQLDKVFGTSYVCTFIGLGLAFAGSGVVMWRAMQAANRLPVPKLTEKQRRAIRKSYEEEDDD